MQAARGTSIAPDEQSESPATPASHTPSRRAIALALGIAVVAVFIDQGTKWWALSSLDTGSERPFVGSLLQLTLVHNPGAAFGTGPRFTVGLTLVAIVAAVICMRFIARLGNLAWAVGLGLLLAGIAGNLTDRLVRDPGPLRGHVVDFLMLPHWPVFNVADICITVAGALIAILVIREIDYRAPRNLPAADAIGANSIEAPDE